MQFGLMGITMAITPKSWEKYPSAFLDPWYMLQSYEFGFNGIPVMDYGNSELLSQMREPLFAKVIFLRALANTQMGLSDSVPPKKN